MNFIEIFNYSVFTGPSYLSNARFRECMDKQNPKSKKKHSLKAIIFFTALFL